MRELLADGDGVVERRASSRACHGIGQQSGEENGYGVAELTGKLYGQEGWRQGVCRRPREGCCTYRAGKRIRIYTVELKVLHPDAGYCYFPLSKNPEIRFSYRPERSPQDLWKNTTGRWDTHTLLLLPANGPKLHLENQTVGSNSPVVLNVQVRGNITKVQAKLNSPPPATHRR